MLNVAIRWSGRRSVPGGPVRPTRLVDGSFAATGIAGKAAHTQDRDDSKRESTRNVTASHEASLSPKVLAQETQIYRTTGGVNRENKERGFLPAFSG